MFFKKDVLKKFLKKKQKYRLFILLISPSLDGVQKFKANTLKSCCVCPNKGKYSTELIFLSLYAMNTCVSYRTNPMEHLSGLFL